jgi:hypothetical protein
MGWFLRNDTSRRWRALALTGTREGLVWRLRAKSTIYQPADRRLKARSFDQLV